MMNPRKEWILHAAKQMYECWKPSYLFLATPKGFFFDKASVIVEKDGIISPFNHAQISEDLQTKYLKLLNKFIIPSERSSEEEG